MDARAINGILSGGIIQKLCAANPRLADEITQSALDFIQNAKMKIRESGGLFETEENQLNEFKKNAANFETTWKTTALFIKKTYPPEIIDTNFYHNEFKNSLNNAKKISFQSVKEHFIEKWEKQLMQKQSRLESERIEEEFKKFCDELSERIEEIKLLHEILKPFTDLTNRLWDMGKDGRQKIKFDILRRYAELLQKDKALQELAEMLGKMQAAEIEYEKEHFIEKIIKPEWKIEHASKADLVGIRESDDINSILPAEVAFLSDPALETVFYKKFAEKKLQTFDYLAKTLDYREVNLQNNRLTRKMDKKGHIIICIDTSGSMYGTPEQVAKTLCFALLKIAVKEERRCYLISFSTRVETLELTDMKNSLDKLIDFLSMSFRGGTNMAPAINEALRMLQTEDYKKADIVMVSDFIMPEFSGETRKDLLSAKENKTKFHSLIIGDGGNQQAIEEFDNNLVYNSNDPERVITLSRNIMENLGRPPAASPAAALAVS